MADDFAICSQSVANVMRFKAPNVTPTSVYDDSVSFSFSFDISSFFQRFRTASLVTPLTILLPKLLQDAATTSYYIGYYKGVNGSSIVFTPDASNSINDLSNGSTFTITNYGQTYMMVIFSYKKTWYIGNTNQSINVSAGTGIAITGSYPNFTITNTAPDQIVSLTSGTGISATGTYPNFTVTNTAPDQTVAIASGTGISATGTYPNFTISNTAPDQTVVLTSGTGITSSGTYPNFTITNSKPDQTVAIASGTGISTTGTYPNFTVTNTAPDQTVTLTAGSNITISGSYPNFTITAVAGMTSKYLNASSSVSSWAFTASTVTNYPGAYTFTSSSGAGDWTNSGSGVITYVGAPSAFYFQVIQIQTSASANFDGGIDITINSTTRFGPISNNAASLGSGARNQYNYPVALSLNTNDTLLFGVNAGGSSGTSTGFQFLLRIYSI